jgi:hypothetical protein
VSYIAYTDDEGATEFSNGLPMPGGKFNGWTPLAPVIGAEEEALGTGEGFIWEFRADYGASFTINEIRQDNVAAALRLIRHLNRFGEVTVFTEDADANIYTCKKWKGREPELSPPDPRSMRRSLKLTLKSLTATDMVVVWP